MGPFLKVAATTPVGNQLIVGIAAGRVRAPFPGKPVLFGCRAWRYGPSDAITTTSPSVRASSCTTSGMGIN